MSRRRRDSSGPLAFIDKRVQLVLMLIIGIFLFICSLEGVKSGFKLIFSEWQAGILGMIDANTAPVTGLAIGILGTALVQSSSAVVAATMVSMSSMVSGGLSMESAMRFGVPMVLGANIGTTITNTIVVFGIKRGMTMKELGETIPGVIVRARINDSFSHLTISFSSSFSLLEIGVANIESISYCRDTIRALARLNPSTEYFCHDTI